MAKFRYVHTEFWQDARVLEEMTPEDKYFYLYLLTNPSTTQVGVYQITKKQMAFDLGYSIESVNSLLERFINHHKLVKYNFDTRELAILHWGKYNLNKAGKPVLDCVKKELSEIKDLSLVTLISKHISNLEIKKAFDNCANGYFEPSRTYKPAEGEKITANKYVLWRDKQTCFYTGLVLQKQDIQIDHIRAKTNGGSGSPDNLVICYSKFNNLKSGTDDLKLVIKKWNDAYPGLQVDYFNIIEKIKDLKEFEKLRFEYEITYRETIENEIYDTYTLRKYIDTIRGQKEKEKEKEKEKDTTTTENPVVLFEKLLCRISPRQSESLYQWVDDFKGQTEIINEAIFIADNKNKRYFGFVEFLLKEWADNKLESLDRVRAYEQEKFNKQKPSRQGASRQKSLFEQGEESKMRQAAAEKEMENLNIDWKKELEDLPY